MSEFCIYFSTVIDDPVSAGIRFRTQCAWSHVGFMRLSDRMTFSAMCDGLGVAWRPLHPDQKILLCDHPGVDLAFEKAETQQGKEYDLLDIVGLGTGFDWHSSNHWICSVLVAWAFDQVGDPVVNMTFIPKIHLTPRDLLLGLNLKERKA